MNAPAPRPAIRTTCPYCGVGCGVLATPDGQGGAEIAGDPQHPANKGRLCSKGSALGETLGLSTRLLHPMVREGGALRRAGWDEALDRVADGLRRIVDAHGPDAVAFYLSGQLLTEDYYVANKLMKGFIGSANVDTNSRLCMASSVAGHRRAFGSDTVPGCYEDLDEADILVLVGSNAAWCHPVLFQRMQANRAARGARLVVIDPRASATAEEADLHLPVAPGTDAILFAGLLVHLADSRAVDDGFVRDHTRGFAEAVAQARVLAPTPNRVAERTGLPAGKVAAFYALFADTPRAVTLFSQGVNQSAGGTDKVNAILNVHLATGRIGRPGMGPFSLTGQPNAMGGREVGGLANQLAAHMDFSPEARDRVGRFWGAQRVPEREGLKAVALFDAIARGEIKALWVMGTNPAVSLPRADGVCEALAGLDLLVVSENVAGNDTLGCKPHVLLTAAAWGEKDGTVTNSERRISRQRAFLPLPGEARPDWWIVQQVARRLGHGAAFSFDGPASIFAEHAALSAFENDGRRNFDIGGLADLAEADYDRLEPAQWPLRAAGSGATRMFGEGGFFTPDRRACFVAVADPASPARPTAFPLLLSTGRVRDQWHTMTRTGLSPRLAGHSPAPRLDMHPSDAAAAGLTEGGLALVSSLHGSAVLRVHVTASQRQGEVFAPIHWSDETAGGARIGALVNDRVDPISGQPDLKATAVTVAPAEVRASGVVLAAQRFPLPACLAWAWKAVEAGFLATFASDRPAPEVADALAALLPSGERIDYADAARGQRRMAAFAGDRLATVAFVYPGEADELPSWPTLRRFWTAPSLTAFDRLILLAGRDAGSASTPDRQVCACFGVSQATIETSIAAGAHSLDALTAASKAGSNCGSCIPELKQLLRTKGTTGARDRNSPQPTFSQADL
ncbi:MAG: molybdopterin-dependent oxidoreductase [Alsobacter sp.]